MKRKKSKETTKRKKSKPKRQKPKYPDAVFDVILLNQTVTVFLKARKPKWVTLSPVKGCLLCGITSYNSRDGYFIWLNARVTTHGQLDNYRHEIGHVLANQVTIHPPEERWNEATANLWGMTLREIDRGAQFINHLYEELGS